MFSVSWVIQYNENGHGYGQLVIGSFIMTTCLFCIVSGAQFLVETSNHPGDSALLQPRYGTLQLLAFPKTKITFEREEISDHEWDSGKYDGAADGDFNERFWRVFWTVGEMLGELRDILRCLFWGYWGAIVLCTMFLVSCIFFNKCLFFILYYWILSGQTS